jgi:hypothetical protein
MFSTMALLNFLLFFSAASWYEMTSIASPANALH